MNEISSQLSAQLIPKGPLGLLKEKRFLPLFCTQFLGAFNDSMYKNALIILIAFSSKPLPMNRDTLINLCAGLFILPFFFFSAFAGLLADKYEKATLIRWIKLVEVILALVAIAGFYFESLGLLLTSLFLLGVQATFFGPLKYSILPQHLLEAELIGGNGLIEMGTFVAILLGTIAGALFMGSHENGPLWVSITLLFFALLGLATSFFIPKAKAYAPELKLEWEPIRQTFKIIRIAYQNKTIFHSIMGISWFWFYGSIFLTQTAHFTKIILGGSEQVVTLLLTIFSVGIGFGSILCAKLSGKKIETGIVLFGSIGLSIFAIDFSFAHSAFPSSTLDAKEFIYYGQNWRLLLDAFLMGSFGGFFVVPLYALIQNRSIPEERSRIIAANNVLNALWMVASAILAIVLLNAGFTIPELFLITGILNAFVMIYLIITVPEFWDRFITWVGVKRYNYMK